MRKRWLKDFRLRKWIIELNDLQVQCKYCQCILKSKLSILLAHGKTRKHIEASSPFQNNNQKTLEYQPVSGSCKTKEAELKEALYIAVHTSIRSVEHLVHLQKHVFFESKAAVEMSLGRTKCTALIKSVLAPHFQKLLAEDISDCNYSLIIDESTDITVDKYLGIVIRYFSKSQQKIVTTFLHLCVLEDTTARGITTEILKVLKDFKLNISNMVGLGTDNAKVMTGVNRGVISLLKEKNENIILVPCICHSIQLAVSAASKCLPDEIEYLISETYNWFAKSSLRQKNYKNIYAAINDDLQPLKLVRACDTRWLSVEFAVNRIENQWLELKTHFDIAATLESCHQAKILKQLYNDKNLLYLKFLKPLLSEVQKTNKMFESNDADPTLLFTELNILLKNLSNQIVLKPDNFDELNSNLENFYIDTPHFNYNFENCINSKRQTIDNETEKEIRITCRNFVAKLIYQLRQRLPKNFETLKNINFFSVENSLKRNKSKLYDHFKEEMTKLTVDYITNLEIQWQNLNSYKWLNQKTTVEFWVNVYEYNNAMNENPFHELSSFVMKFLVLPFSNAEVERVFSGMNLIKTKIRNRLVLNTMNSLLYIRCGLKRINKCCKDFQITKDLIRNCDKNIYNNDDHFADSSDVEEYSFNEEFNL